MCIQRVLGRHMHLAHKPLRTKRPDGQNGEINLRKMLSDLLGLRSGSGIAGKIKSRILALHHEAAPQASYRLETDTVQRSVVPAPP